MLAVAALMLPVSRVKLDTDMKWYSGYILLALAVGTLKVLTEAFAIDPDPDDAAAQPSATLTSSGSGGGKAVGSGAAGARVVVDTSASKECYVCLGADATVVPLGCACRGAAGSAHVACMIEAAVHAFAENNLSWSVCSLCKQWYTGEMQLELAEERMCRVKHLPEIDMEWQLAQLALGRALEHNGQYDRAIVVCRKMLSLSSDT